MKPAAERGNKISGAELMGARLVKLETGQANLFASMFRTMLLELNVTPELWDRMMDGWLNDPANRVGPSDRARGAARRYLNAQLRQLNMTPYVFKKALRFLGVGRADLELKITASWTLGKVTEHRALYYNFLSK